MTHWKAYAIAPCSTSPSPAAADASEVAAADLHDLHALPEGGYVYRLEHSSRQSDVAKPSMAARELTASFFAVQV